MLHFCPLSNAPAGYRGCDVGAGTKDTVQVRMTGAPPPGPVHVCVPLSVPPVLMSLPL